MQRRTFLRLVAAAALGTVVKTTHKGEIQHWTNGPFGEFIWTGKNPRLLAYQGKIPAGFWDDFLAGRNPGFVDIETCGAVIKEIDDVEKLLATIKRDGHFTRVS